MLEAEKYREALKNAKRIVIKVGTSTITYANGKRNFSQIDRLAREISDLQNQGKEIRPPVRPSPSAPRRCQGVSR